MKKLISMALIAIVCLSATACTEITDSTKVKHCNGITAKGMPCKSNFIPKGLKYCNAHNPAAVKCSGTNSKGKPCGNKVSVKSEFCRFHK